MLRACVFCCPTARETVAKVLKGCDAQVHTDWSAFVQSARQAPILGVVLELKECVPVQEVLALRQGLTDMPFILCAPRTTAVDHALDFDRSVHRGELQERLGPLIRHHQFRVARARTRAFILDGDHHLTSLREPIAYWLEMETIPRFASTAAKSSGRTLGALERAFLAEVRPEGGATVKRSIDAVVLYRACELLALGQRLPAVAQQVGVSTKTLRRMARRAWHTTAAELPRLSPPEAVALLLRPLGLRYDVG